jgi:hypothetical protein
MTSSPTELMPVHPDTIVSNLTAATTVLNKWRDVFQSEEWRMDFNLQNPEYQELIMAQFLGELKVSAASLAVLVEVLR